MATPVIAPREGETTSCVLISWKRRKGDKVRFGDELGTVETDKATMDILSPGEGTVLALLYSEGEELPASAPVAIIGDAGEDIAALLNKEAVKAKDVAEEIRLPANRANEVASVRGRIKITPKAKKFAKENGIALDGISGTGTAGSICYRDVSSKATSPALITDAGPIAQDKASSALQDSRSPFAPQEQAQKVLSGFEKSSAERMMQSLYNSAQYTLHADANAGTLLSLRSRYKNSGENIVSGITLNDMLLFAVSRTLRRYPIINAELINGTLTEYNAVNLAFALDTPKGLAVPVIHDADKLSLTEISLKAKELIEKGREGRLAPGDLSHGSFMVSNLGGMGITYFTPILNPPQVGILGIGKIRPMPQYHEEEIRFESTLSLSLTLDHQIVDGATGARFLADLSSFIRDFDLMAFIPCG